MTSRSHEGGLSWSARLLIAVALILAGAAAAAWALARYDQAARFLGVTPEPRVQTAAAPPATTDAQEPVPQNAAERAIADAANVADERISELEQRLERIEGTAQRVEGSAGRADALLVAFAARRAVDRGVALGYLEPLLVDRFGATHPRAVATIVTGSHSPVRLGDLIDQYRELGPVLRSSAPEEGWWSQFKRELGSLIRIRRSDRPSTQPDARYQRALTHLEDGEVDEALAQTMRLPGAQRADEWIRKAREYVRVRRALDSIESAALLGRSERTAG